MKNIIKFFGIITIAVVIIFSTGCSTLISWNKVNLDLDSPTESQIHNLKNETVELVLKTTNTVEFEEEIQIQISNIMGNFFNSHGEEYGYYTLNFTYQPFSTIGGMALAMLTGASLFSTYLLGVPWTVYDYKLNASLHLYNSAGEVVGTYQNSTHFYLAQGLYYNNTPNKKAGKYFSELLGDLLRQADHDSITINKMLEIAGPITVEKSASARSKIKASENR